MGCVFIIGESDDNMRESAIDAVYRTVAIREYCMLYLLPDFILATRKKFRSRPMGLYIIRFTVL